MNLGLDLSIIISILLAMLAAMGGLVKILFSQFEKRLDERWKLVEETRAQAMRQWEATFTEHIRREELEFSTMRNFEQQFMTFARELPTMYLRRDEMKDYLIRLDMKFETINERLQQIGPQPAIHHDHPAL